MSTLWNRILPASLLLLFAWILMTGSLQPQELATGALVAVVVAFIALPTLHLLDDFLLSPLLPWHMLHYLLVFFRALIESNIDMARRVLSPSLPIYPAVVEVHTELHSPLGRLLLANSITLTPGTLTVDVNDDRLRVHWIDARGAEELEAATRAIAARFERPLKRMVR